MGLYWRAADLFEKISSPTSPSPAAPPAPNAPIRYAAIGVGGSVPCVSFTPCENGTGYVPVLARQLRASREVTLTNLGIPASVLSPAIETLARQHGRDVTGNFVDRELPFVPRDSTLVTIFGWPGDVNAVGDAMKNGAAGSNITGYIEAQARTFGADYDRLVSGVRGRAPSAFIVILNVPNLAGLPYASQYPLEHRRVLQALSVAFSREANRQAASGAVVVDLMCDPAAYAVSQISSDGYHPNDAGYFHIASRLAAVVNGGPAPVQSTCGQATLVPPL
ncbi:MAG: hypothetical protein A3H29_16340 [Acidobacteria bacterium RIFCSPLOWO2_02_FULL_67_21]|nr:MAG: hypothetical protein A3H29_16340 [Acidobacteria bacterium RIFCSPLOWO2_02_FULL_67_21]